MLAVTLALAACGGERATALPVQEAVAPVPSPAAAGASTKRAPVVVAIVIDQLSAWVAEERVPKLPADGFFARLAREGTWVRTLRFPYAITDTAPGHAALHTGRVPSETHIVVNEVADEKTGVRTSFFHDAGTKLVTPAGVRDTSGSSAAALAVPTVADQLRAARPHARIVSISLKDRAALLPAGQHPDHALWFDVGEGSFVTSTAIEPTFPAWARAAGDAGAIAKSRATTWEPLEAKWLVENAGKDDAPGEGDLDGLGITFPHHARSARAFRATPMSDDRILELALAAARDERNAQEPLLLLVSLSASDIIGHTFGPNSWEAWDQLRRLDGALARFMVSLEAEVGRVSVIVSGDHGNSPMPEARRPLPASCAAGTTPPDAYDRPLCTIGGRLEPTELRSELRAEAAKTVGSAELVVGIADSYVVLSPAARALGVVKRAALGRAVEHVLLGAHGSEVAALFDVRDLATRCPAVRASARGIPERARAGEDTITLVCRSWTTDAGAGDYFVVPRHGFFFDGEVVPGKGASHGTPWLYDRTVPLFVRGAPGDVDAGAIILDPVDFSAYAEVEAALLGLDSRKPRAILDALRAR